MDIIYYTTYDLAIPYRNIKIYPITVKDYLMFTVYSQCLTLDKNSVPDPKIISMSELEYMYYSTNKDAEKTPYLIWFDRILSLCLKDDESFNSVEESIKRYNYNDKNKPIFYLKNELYNSKDFIQIKKIICEQNLLDIPDDNISKDVRDSLDKAREYKNRISNTKASSIEDYIIAISTATGWSMEYIYSMSVRKFIKSIRRLDNLIHYKIYLSASMSGMVEFKDKSFIKHWLTNLDDDNKYGDVSMDLEEVQNKVSLESAK